MKVLRVKQESIEGHYYTVNKKKDNINTKYILLFTDYMDFNVSAWADFDPLERLATIFYGLFYHL